MKAPSLVSLALFVLACFGVAAAGGAATATSVGSWYQTLAKPPFNPPNWVFGPVWTALFLMIAVSGWRVWERRERPGARLALAAWGLQLALNLGWSLVFFGLRSPGGAAVEIVALLAAIVATTVLSWRIDRAAGWLLVPYIAWVSFAAVLNFSIYALN